MELAFPNIELAFPSVQPKTRRCNLDLARNHSLVRQVSTSSLGQHILGMDRSLYGRSKHRRSRVAMPGQEWTVVLNRSNRQKATSDDGGFPDKW
jgi:hypothetical protein